MGMYSDEYRDFIVQSGVGRKDKVASSPDSYVNYLGYVSNLLNRDISPGLVQNEEAISLIMQELKGRRAKKTLNNYKTALNRYLEFVLDRNRRNALVTITTPLLSFVSIRPRTVNK